MIMTAAMKSEDDGRMMIKEEALERDDLADEELLLEEDEECLSDGCTTNASCSPNNSETELKSRASSVRRALQGGNRGGGGGMREAFVKQMEQQQLTMDRMHCSDFIRSLAAKYNKRNSSAEEQDDSLSHVNGFMHKLDGGVFGRVGSADGILKAATPPLLHANHDDVIRRSDNHSAPPVLLGHHKSNLLRPGVDLSSTKMLIHMISAATATTAAGMIPSVEPVKRQAEAEFNALDLSVRAHKRWRGDGCGLFPVLSDPIGLFSPSRGSGHRGQPAIGDTGANSLSRSMGETEHSPKKILRVSSGSHKKFLQQQQHLCASNCACKDKKQSTSAVVKWSVDDVCAFVRSVDACADYVQAFREQSIDGSALYMLTEEHLTNRMKMKLGHALRFKAALAKLIGACAQCLHCVHCHQTQPQLRNGGSSALQRHQ